MIGSGLGRYQAYLLPTPFQPHRLTGHPEPHFDLGAHRHESNVRRERIRQESVALVAAVVTDTLPEQTSRDADDDLLAHGDSARGSDSAQAIYAALSNLRAVLDELMRVGAVIRTTGNRLRLNARVYIPRASEIGKLMILGADV